MTWAIRQSDEYLSDLFMGRGPRVVLKLLFDLLFFQPIRTSRTFSGVLVYFFDNLFIYFVYSPFIHGIQCKK